MDQLLNAYIYEVKKGTKPMALLTVPVDVCENFTNKIKKNNLSFFVQEINQKCNIFFGSPECVDIVRRFRSHDLSKLSEHEDFILGIMLGYNRLEQCRRYLNKLNLHPIR